MAENKLEVEIGLDLLSLQTGVKKAKKEMISLEKQMEQLNDEFEKGLITEEQLAQKTENLSREYAKFDKEIRDNTKSIQNLRNQTKNLANTTSGSVTPAMQNLSKATGANAIPALQEFSRVIQDAPFGIVGVGNNITQLVSQFGYLSKSTGGAKNALKAMVGSLAGPGGVLFGISTLVTLLTVYGDEIKGFISGTDGATDALSDEAKELEKVTKELNGYYEAIKQATEGTAEYNGLINSATAIDNKLEKALSNTNLTEQERQELIRKRIEVLNLEAKAQKQKTKLLDQENGKTKKFIESLQKSLDNRIKLREEIEQGNKTYGKESQQYKNNEAQIKKLQSEISRQSKVVQENYKEYGILINEVSKANDEFDNMSNKMKENSVAFFNNQIALLKEQQELASTAQEFRDLGKEIDKVQSKIDKITTTGLAPKSRDLVQNISTNLQTEGVTELTPMLDFNPQLNMKPLLSSLQTGFTDAELKAIEFSEQMKAVLANSLANTFSTLGEIIGDALSGASNELGNGGDRLLANMGKLLTDLGNMAIAFGSTMLAMQISASSFNPFIAIGAGVALVAIGKAFSNTASKGVQQGSSYASGGSGGSAPQTRRYTSGNSASGGIADGNVVFEIQGTKLVGVLNNTLKRNKSIGGANNLLFN